MPTAHCPRLFTKMHGAGNDYICVDCFAQPMPENPSALARQVSDRHFGIGGDGLILMCPVKMANAEDAADAEMRMFNADGSPSEMCGNGIRCVAKYVHDHGIARRNQLRIASAGTVYALDLMVIDGKVARVRVDMGQPILASEQIPTTLPGDPVVETSLVVLGQPLAVTCLSMGNPHCVVFVEELADEWVLDYGPKIEIDSHFPNRTNVEFVEIISPIELCQRTWERGSGETLACGTGASAVCVAGALTGQTERSVLIHLPGGDLELEWRERDNHVYMTGPAEEVFSGEWPARIFHTFRRERS